MTKHNTRERGGAPTDKLQMLNPYGEEQYRSAHNRTELCRQLAWGSLREQYFEVWQRLQEQASQQAMGALGRMGQGAVQGANVQAPAAWMPVEQVRADAPQGGFTPEEINAARSHPEQGFADMYVPVDQQTMQEDARRDAAAKFEQFVLDQAAADQWGNPN